MEIPEPKFKSGDVVVMRKHYEVPTTNKYEAEKKMGLNRYVVNNVAYEYPSGPFIYWIRDDHQAFHSNIFFEAELISNAEAIVRAELEMTKFK